jgi:2-C-methyl-D-erythritol 2,4-cyclodiphosphate synthase
MAPAQKRASRLAPRIRIGQGFDAHALVPGRDLILGGVRIASPVGLLGHSDADALAHALTDAVLGAAGAGDIGTLFPDTDARWRGADSIALLAEAVRVAAGRGWRVVNADCTVIAQRPRIAPHVEAMRGNLARALCVEAADVGVKGKTTEQLGFPGRGEGIAVLAVVLLAGA